MQNINVLTKDAVKLNIQTEMFAYIRQLLADNFNKPYLALYVPEGQDINTHKKGVSTR